MEVIKSRKAEISTRGIYIQDKELLQTVFQVGSFFKFQDDPEKKLLTVLPSDEQGKNTVSKRQMKGYIKPVIDIRVKSLLKMFEGCTGLQVTLYSDKIEIQGITEETV